MNAKELTVSVEGLEAVVKALTERSAAAHQRLLDRMAADRAAMRILHDRVQALEAKLAETPRVITRATKTAKVGNHAQWMSAIATLKAAGVEPANGAGMYCPETQVFPEMFRLFPALAGTPAAAPAPAPVEAKAPMASVVAEEDAMF